MVQPPAGEGKCDGHRRAATGKENSERLTLNVELKRSEFLPKKASISSLRPLATLASLRLASLNVEYGSEEWFSLRREKVKCDGHRRAVTSGWIGSTVAVEVFPSSFVAFEAGAFVEFVRLFAEEVFGDEFDFSDLVLRPAFGGS